MKLCFRKNAMTKLSISEGSKQLIFIRERLFEISNEVLILEGTFGVAKMGLEKGSPITLTSLLKQAQVIGTLMPTIPTKFDISKVALSVDIALENNTSDELLALNSLGSVLICAAEALIERCYLVVTEVSHFVQTKAQSFNTEKTPS